MPNSWYFTQHSLLLACFNLFCITSIFIEFLKYNASDFTKYMLYFQTLMCINKLGDTFIFCIYGVYDLLLIDSIKYN